MNWSRDYVEVLLRFAARVAEIEDLSIDHALLAFTPLYLNLGLTRSFDPLDPTWQEFLTGYHAAVDSVSTSSADSAADPAIDPVIDPVTWVHSFYLAHARQYGGSPYGCFAYTYEPDTQTIRFHFANRDTSGHGPLSVARQQARREELAMMFAAIRREIPQATAVRGRSWMYNLPAYQRLFPPEYVQTAIPVEPEFQFMSLWGQFLHHAGALRRDPATAFLNNISLARSLDDIARCFPLPVRAPRCDITHFYMFYGIN